MQLNAGQHAVALDFACRHAGAGLTIQNNAVCIGRADQLDAHESALLETILKNMRPFRKGPFEIFGQRIDANWKSDRKWERLQKYLPDPSDLQGKSVCDIGCNNGYYMFRLQAWVQQNSTGSGTGLQEVVGLEPVRQHQQCFEFLQSMAGMPGLQFVTQGYEWLQDQQERFDLILCLGILYHHTDPVRILRLIQGALKKGGRVIVESLGLPTVGSAESQQTMAANCLVPAGRYAGMRGVWHVPGAPALIHWMRRSGLQQVELLEEHEYASEQVRTYWGDLPGLTEVLDPANPDRTIEGYPAPVRIWAIATR